MRLCFFTTFPNTAWRIYAAEAVASMRRCLPPEVRIGVGLDDDTLRPEVLPRLGPGDDVFCGWGPDHQAFAARNAGKDHPTNYRLQAVRFCHKFFFLKEHHDRLMATGVTDCLVWWDGDAVFKRPVTLEELAGVLPGESQACSYLGRKDWDHSECGFMAFNLRHPGTKAILDFMRVYYVEEYIFGLPQWHDCLLFDIARKDYPCLNLSEGVPGNNVWAKTALGAFSEHRKGEEAKRRSRPLTDDELFGNHKTV